MAAILSQPQCINILSTMVLTCLTFSLISAAVFSSDSSPICDPVRLFPDTPSGMPGPATSPSTCAFARSSWFTKSAFGFGFGGRGPVFFITGSFLATCLGTNLTVFELPVYFFTTTVSIPFLVSTVIVRSSLLIFLDDLSAVVAETLFLSRLLARPPRESTEWFGRGVPCWCA